MGLRDTLIPVAYTTPTGINPGWTCDCRQLYLTQELDLLCVGIVVVLTKSFISFVTKNKYLAVNPPSTSAEIFGVSQKQRDTRRNGLDALGVIGSGSSWAFDCRSQN